MLHAKERGGEDVIKNAAFVKRRGEQLFQDRFGTHTKNMKHQQLLFDWQCIAKWIVRHSDRLADRFPVSSIFMTCKSVVPRVFGGCAAEHFSAYSSNMKSAGSSCGLCS